MYQNKRLELRNPKILLEMTFMLFNKKQQNKDIKRLFKKSKVSQTKIIHKERIRINKDTFKDYIRLRSLTYFLIYLI